MGWQEKVGPQMALDIWELCTLSQALSPPGCLFLPQKDKSKSPEKASFKVEAWMWGTTVEETQRSTRSLLPYVPYWKKRKSKKDKQQKSIAAKVRGQGGCGGEMTLPSAGTRTEISAGPRAAAAGRAGALRRPSRKTQARGPCRRGRPNQNNREHSPSLPIMRLTSFK